MKTAVVVAVWLGCSVSGCVNVEAERRFSALSWDEHDRYERCRPYMEEARCGRAEDRECSRQLREWFAAPEKDEAARTEWLLRQGCPEPVGRPRQVKQAASGGTT